jgi:hypothetical protein
MTIEIGMTNSSTNTQFAPLAVLSAHYQQNHTLDPLKQVLIPMKKRTFSTDSKLIQILLSILAGCETLSEVNLRLKSEPGLASVWGWERFADQSSLSRTLDALTLMNIDQLRQNTTAIWWANSQIRTHDWRRFLWLDFDLSGLPCSPGAENSQKGYFSGKKMSLDANWPASAPLTTEKPSGRKCIQATNTRFSA